MREFTLADFIILLVALVAIGIILKARYQERYGRKK
jgi:hypothetical protein